MNIYELRRSASDVDYGVTEAQVIVAPSEKAARDMARGNEFYGDSKALDWLEPSRTSCERIGIAVPGLRSGIRLDHTPT